MVHTERAYDAAVSARLLDFCDRFEREFGARPICAVMTGVNARTRQGMREHGIGERELAARLRELAARATLGHHGHFWLDPREFARPEQAVRANNFAAEPVREQLAADVAWLRDHDLDHHGLYAAGWWFLNDHVLSMLARQGFRVDFSVSASPWFRNEPSQKLRTENALRAGEPFERDVEGRRMLFVPNLIGCDAVATPRAFERALAPLLRSSHGSAIGVVNAHDYGLDMENAIACLRRVRDTQGVEVLDAEALVEAAAKAARTLPPLLPRR
jgi:hypothetical protein